MSWGDIDTPGMPPAKPSLERLETIVRLCEQRDRRADAKVLAANTEKTVSAAALERARAERDDWIANNDDPQLMML